eukprot:23269-Pelagococcus_subviridis.AAC.3
MRLTAMYASSFSPFRHRIACGQSIGGSDSIALTASALCSLASAFVRSIPLLRFTQSCAVSTSPTFLNLRSINAPNPSCSSAANNTGAVAIPSLKSPSVGFPSTLPVPVKSKTSSWN